MASGSKVTSSNKSLGYDLLNHKMRLLDTGSAIRTAGITGAGQEAYATATSAGLIKGTDYIANRTGTLLEPKIANLLWGTKWGTFYPVSSTIGNNVDGILTGVSATGTLAVAALDTTEGIAATFTTAASGGSQGGINRALLFTTRQFNPTFKLRWKIDEAAGNIRFFAGFTGATAAIGNSDDPLNALAGFGIAINTIQANYQIYSNDTTGATILTDTGVAKDTAFHTIELWADDNGAAFYWSLDDSTPSAITSNIPAQTTSLSCQFLATAVNADAKVLSVPRFVITSDK